MRETVFGYRFLNSKQQTIFLYELTLKCNISVQRKASWEGKARFVSLILCADWMADETDLPRQTCHKMLHRQHFIHDITV